MSESSQQSLRSFNLVIPKSDENIVPSVSVDCVIFGFENDELKVLLIQHDGGPKDGDWALPGDFLYKNLPLQDIPYEVLERLTGIKDIYVKQLGAFGDLERVDYRRVITIAYYALISPGKYTISTGRGSKAVEWYGVNDHPELIFDHNQIIEEALMRLRKELHFLPIGLELLPEKFTLTQLQKLYEGILGRKLDTRNFRRKILNSNILFDTKELDKSVPYRAPKLFSFDHAKYKEKLEEGFYFPL